MKEKHFVAVIIFLGAILFFSFLGAADLWNPDEPRDAEIAREMFTSKDYVVPTLNGAAFLEKPPLFYWLVCAASRLKGKVTETTARFPSAFFAVLGMLVTFYLGKNVFGKSAGFLSALLLACFFQYWWMGRRASLDMPFSFFVTASLFFFFKSYFTAKNKWRYFLLFYLCGSLAVLTKGLLGIMLVSVVVFSFLFLQRNLKFLFSWHLIGGLFLFACLFSPWVYFLWKQGGMEHLHTFFVVNHLQRFAGKFGGHNQPFYYYVQTLLVDFLPWSLFLPFVISFVKNELSSLSGESKKKFQFAVCWFLSMFVLLTVSKSKREIYLLPAYAPIAVLLAGTLSRIHERNLFATSKVVRRFTYVFVAIPVLLCVVLAAVLLSSLDDGGVSVAILGLLLFYIIDARKFFRRNELVGVVDASIGVILFIFCMSVFMLFQPLNLHLSTKPFAEGFHTLTKQHQVREDMMDLYMFRVPEGMQGAYLFYFERMMPLIDDEKEMMKHAENSTPTCFLMKKEEFDAVKPRFENILFPAIISESKGQRGAVLACNKKWGRVHLKNGHVVNVGTGL